MESYRAQAPKKLLKALEAEPPWVAAGALPGSATATPPKERKRRRAT
jgi:hypothetical protein